MGVVHSIYIEILLVASQSFYREIAGYGMSVGDHGVARRWKWVMGQQNSYMTLIEVHLPMHLMHPN